MRVLITWGSKLGGTEGIARVLGEALERDGLDVALVPAEAARPDDYDAVIVGGALYAFRWHRAARRFVARNERMLRRVPVWFFSSGPLDHSADKQVIPPVPQVAALMERIGARGHVTFGGRLAPDAKGFPASAMAKKNAGDWRNLDRVRAWAEELAVMLPTARPGIPVAQPGHTVGRVVTHGALGWAACAVVMLGLLSIASTGAAIALHAVAAPLVFAAISRHYFGAKGARAPGATALAFVAITGALDLVIVAGLFQRSLAMFGSFGGTWLPLALIFLATWVTGTVMSFLPYRPIGPPAHGSALSPTGIR